MGKSDDYDKNAPWCVPPSPAPREPEGIPRGPRLNARVPGAIVPARMGAEQGALSKFRGAEQLPAGRLDVLKLCAVTAAVVGE